MGGKGRKTASDWSKSWCRSRLEEQILQKCCYWNRGLNQLFDKLHQQLKPSKSPSNRLNNKNKNNNRYNFNRASHLRCSGPNKSEAWCPISFISHPFLFFRSHSPFSHSSDFRKPTSSSLSLSRPFPSLNLLHFLHLGLCSVFSPSCSNSECFGHSSRSTPRSPLPSH